MWKIWMVFDPRQAVVGLFTFLGILAFSIHFLLLSTDRYNWLDQPPGMDSGATAANHNSGLPTGYR